jgi:hypothetical protein
MENSILISTKKVLGIADDYTAFDIDIIMHINSVFSMLTQMGVGPAEGFFIEDDTAEWGDYIANDNVYNMIRSYMFLKVRMLFDPPSTSFLVTAMEKQIGEYEWRISTHREWLLNPVDPALEV